MTLTKFIYWLFFTLTILFNSHVTLAKIAKNVKPLEAYSELPNKSLVRTSPNGELLAYRSTENNKDFIAIIDIKNQKFIQGFDISEIQPENLYFIGNDKLVFRVFERKKIRGYIGFHNVSTAFLYDIKENKLSQLLVPGKGIHQGQTEIGNISGISADGKWAFMPAYSLTADGGVPKYSLMKVNLRYTYKTPILHNLGTEDTRDYFVDGDGEVLARERYDQETNIHQIQVPDKTSWRTIFSEKTPYIVRSFSGLTPDRKSLIMVARNDQDRSAYYLLSLADGSISAPLFERDDADIESVLSDVNRVVYGVRYSGFKPSYAFFDDKIKQHLANIQAELPTASVTLIDHTSDWKKLIVYVEGEGLTGDFLSHQNKALKHVAKMRNNIEWEDVNNVVEFSFKARDGLVIPTLLTIPNSAIDSKEKMSAILMPHGGPESYDQNTFNWLAQYFANRGHLVIQPQFRGSSGFGANHTLKGRGEWGKKMQDDLTDAVNKLIDMGEIDKDRVCIVGSSYGGYAALAGAAFTPEVYQCAVAINGIGDIARMLKEEKSDHGKDSSALSYWQEVISQNQLDDEVLDNISPQKHVDKIDIPVLLIYGSIDEIVSPEQSENMYEALIDNKKDASLVKLTGVGHDVLKEESRLKVLQEVDKFISQHIGQK